MSQSSIEWTERVWNPTTGCTKVSQGCKFCYAEVFARRLQAMGLQKYANGFELALHPDVLDAPRKWKPSRIFVNSMSDLFHEAVPLSYIQDVFRVMNECPQHRFQVLTKREERLQELSPILNWTPNIWMGVSVENQQVADRIECLRKTGAAVKFLSLEPLLGPLPGLDLRDISWVIAGGESGRRARPMKETWVLDILSACRTQNVPFFFKQWGAWGPDGLKRSKKENGRLLQGRVWEEYPEEASGVQIGGVR